MSFVKDPAASSAPARGAAVNFNPANYSRTGPNNSG